MKLPGVFSLLVVFVFALSNCRHGYDNTAHTSSYGNSESHNMGKNCMSCHRLGGEGSGWFIAAGTVYDKQTGTTAPNGTVRLYTGINGTGTLVATLQVDGKGNFYTTNKINFGNGLFPVHTSSSGNVNYMSTSITVGACNSCHGVSTAFIFTN